MFKVTIEEIKQVPAFEKKYDSEQAQYVYTPIAGKTTDDNRTVYSQFFENLSVSQIVTVLNKPLSLYDPKTGESFELPHP